LNDSVYNIILLYVRYENIFLVYMPYDAMGHVIHY